MPCRSASSNSGLDSVRDTRPMIAHLKVVKLFERAVKMSLSVGETWGTVRKTELQA